MNIQQLNDAIRRRDVTELQRAYRECRGAGLTPRDAPQMNKARQTIDILNMSNSTFYVQSASLNSASFD